MNKANVPRSGRGMDYADYVQDETEQMAADLRYRQAILGEEALV